MAMIGPVVTLVLGGVVAATGILGWVGRLPRNRVAGLRIWATMRSDEAFVEGNRAAGPATTIGGIVAMCGSAVALFLPDPDAKTVVFLAVVTMALFALIGAVQGARRARGVSDGQP